MHIQVFDALQSLSASAARHAAEVLRRAIAQRGSARVVAATAASQLDFQRELVRAADVAWPKVEVFQLDEYVGLPVDHPASFRTMLLEHLVRPAGVTSCHTIDGSDPVQAAADISRAIATAEVDLALLGIGENAHLAFNDPPADFDTTDPYIVVTLDAACRRQQVGEGWFARVEDVPTQAVTMSIRQMLKAHEIVVVVPDRRKAAAVKATLEAPISPAVPASILRTHPSATLFLDEPAASMLAAPRPGGP